MKPNERLGPRICVTGLLEQSGRGFYDWTGCDATEVQRQANDRLQRLIAFLEDSGA